MKKLVTVGSFGAKIAIVITATVGGTALVGSSVFASLTATAFNTSAQSVSTGTLKLVQTPSTNSGQTAGFSTSVFPITGMAPGDTTTRFIDLTQGSIAGTAMTLGLADASTTPSLTTGTYAITNGLQVAVSECTIAYALGVCPTGATETPLISTSANALLGTKPLGVSAADLAPNGITHFKFVLTLPAAATEVSNNGSLPASTIQGANAQLTWTFTEAQRTSTNTVA